MEASKFKSLIEEVIKEKISDLHISSNNSPYIRNKIGDMVAVKNYGIMSDADVLDVCELVRGKPFTEGSIDCSYSQGNGRFRVNMSRVIDGTTLAMRLVPSVIPTPDEILLTEPLLKITGANKGLILITGPTGSGKSTTMATMLEHINKGSRRHIITLEDPVEFVYENKLSLINQRELGRQFDTFQNGIRSVLREDPDVIVIGEMRDLETIEAAITLAETGHLVFSTLHTNDTVQTVDRIIQSFPYQQQNQIRAQLGLALKAVISQVLLPKSDVSGRIVAREIMFNNDSIRNLIIRGETQHLYGVLELSKQEGMILMDEAIAQLVKHHEIYTRTAQMAMRDPSRLSFIGKA